MTKIKLCGLSRRCDIEAANALMPDYVGFVFAEGSKRRVTPAQAQALKNALSPGILAVGVFVDEAPATVAALLGGGIIDAAQLHGGEDAAYIRALRRMTDRPIWQAFRVRTRADVEQAGRSEADCILLDAGAVPHADILITVIAFAVSAMPEGLPLGLTMALTIASNRMPACMLAQSLFITFSPSA